MREEGIKSTGVIVDCGAISQVRPAGLAGASVPCKSRATQSELSRVKKQPNKEITR